MFYYDLSYVGELPNCFTAFVDWSVVISGLGVGLKRGSGERCPHAAHNLAQPQKNMQRKIVLKCAFNRNCSD